MADSKEAGSAIASAAATLAVVGGIILAVVDCPFVARHDASDILERIRFIDGPPLAEPVRALQYDRAKKAALIDLIRAGCRGGAGLDRRVTMTFRGDDLEVRAALRRQYEVRRVLDALRGGSAGARPPRRSDGDLSFSLPRGELVYRLR